MNKKNDICSKLAKMIIQKTFFVFLLLFLISCSTPKYIHFNLLSQQSQGCRITIAQLNMSENNCVGFISDSLQSYMQFAKPSATYSFIKPNTCYNIKRNELFNLAADALSNNHLVQFYFTYKGSDLYLSPLGYTIKNDEWWYLFLDDGKRIRIKEDKLFNNTKAIVLHKEAARSVLENIIK